MTMKSGLYGITLRDILDASALPVDLISDTIKVALVTDSHTPDLNAHDEITDITNQVTGTGYTAGGAALASKTLTAASGYVTYDAADLAWTTATFSNAEGGLVWDDTVTSPTADPLVAAVDFGAPYSVTAGTFTIQWHANGILRVKVDPSV